MTTFEDCKAYALPLMKAIAVVADEWENIPLGILVKLNDLADALHVEIQDSLDREILNSNPE
jgi:hypothetical protein